MAATAAARSAPRRAPKRRAAPVAPARGQLIPLAVGRTAVAMRDLPDSGLVMRMTRGRLWIGVLGTMLAGIVALNVVSLSISSTSSQVSQQMTALERQNSELKARIEQQTSNQRVLAAATRLGLQLPAPGDINYLNAGPGDAARAARLLAGGQSSSALAAVPGGAAQTTPSTPASNVAHITPASGGASTPPAAPRAAPITNPQPSSSHAGGIAPG